MNTLLSTIAIASTLTSGIDAPGTRSIDTVITPTKITVTYLRDGHDNYAAITAPLYTIAGTDNRLKIVSFGATDRLNTQYRLYVGTGLSYEFVRTDNINLSLIAGWKGFNVSDNFRLSDNDRAWVFGVGLSFKID